MDLCTVHAYHAVMLCTNPIPICPKIGVVGGERTLANFFVFVDDVGILLDGVDASPVVAAVIIHTPEIGRACG